ncbi:MAG: hypothetical protein HY470_01065 [Candidatus Ryanbacteria bacterium]|nr:hypothetical protein [Candidatus Ryanbacteria bacterium]
MEKQVFVLNKRDAFIITGTAFVSAALLISASVWATTIGTNIDADGTVGAATSTPWGTLAAEQTATQGAIDPTFVVGDTGSTSPFIFVSPKGVVTFGSTTPSPLFLNPADVVIGRNGSTNDLYVSGGLGVANATTADSDLIVGGGNVILSYTSNGRLVVGATSTALTSPKAPNKFVFDGGKALFSSGGTGTTTVSILSEADADGANACIQMSSDGLTYRVFINGAGTGLTVQLGSCAGD